MIGYVDAIMSPDEAWAGVSLFGHWKAKTPLRTYFKKVTDKIVFRKPYTIFSRDLVCMREILNILRDDFPQILVFRGYTIGTNRSNGIGAYLAKEFKVPVIGVTAEPVTGASKSYRGGCYSYPLYVTCIGISKYAACENIESMQGCLLLPNLFKDLRRKCRDNMYR